MALLFSKFYLALQGSPHLLRLPFLKLVIYYDIFTCGHAFYFKDLSHQQCMSKDPMLFFWKKLPSLPYHLRSMIRQWQSLGPLWISMISSLTCTMAARHPICGRGHCNHSMHSLLPQILILSSTKGMGMWETSTSSIV